MKKLYAILAGALLVGTTASAQRLIDLSATLNSPATGSTVANGANIAIDAVIQNVSANTLLPTDTILYQFFIGSNPVSNVYFRTGVTLQQGDTMRIVMNPTLTFGTQTNGQNNFCIAVQPFNSSADSVADNVAANNASCNQLTFVGGVSVETVELSNKQNHVLNVFPVPATNQANFELMLNENSNVNVRIMDITGRTVATESKGSFSKGKHTISVNTMNLPQGIYMYQVIMNEETATGKLTIAK